MEIIHTAVLQAVEDYWWHHQAQEKADAKVMVVSSLHHLIHLDLSHVDVHVDASSTNDIL